MRRCTIGTGNWQPCANWTKPGPSFPHLIYVCISMACNIPNNKKMVKLKVQYLAQTDSVSFWEAHYNLKPV